MECDLNVIMRGLLSPNDMREAMERASTKKAEDFKYLQSKSDFLSSPMGKGVILLSLSMIKYSWYVVMKTNFENFLTVPRRSLGVSSQEKASNPSTSYILMQCIVII